MATVTALLENREQAEEAIRELLDRGIPADDIGVMMRDESEADELAAETGTTTATEAVAIGGLVGGLGGLLAGLVAATIPGFGLVIAAGPLASVLAGSATGMAVGGLLGALVDAGLSEDQARSYQTGIERGGVLVAVHAENARITTVQEVLSRYGRPGRGRAAGEDEVPIL